MGGRTIQNLDYTLRKSRLSSVLCMLPAEVKVKGHKHLCKRGRWERNFYHNPVLFIILVHAHHLETSKQMLVHPRLQGSCASSVHINWESWTVTELSTYTPIPTHFLPNLVPKSPPQKDTGSRQHDGRRRRVSSFVNTTMQW